MKKHQRDLSDGEWQEHGACREVDPELWFPGKGEPTRDAVKICGGCEVKVECLEYALSHRQDIGRHGVWGGTTERQRRRIWATQVVEGPVAA